MSATFPQSSKCSLIWSSSTSKGRFPTKMARFWSRSAGVAVAMSTRMTQPLRSLPFKSQLLLAQSASLNL